MIYSSSIDNKEENIRRIKQGKRNTQEERTS